MTIRQPLGSRAITREELLAIINFNVIRFELERSEIEKRLKWEEGTLINKDTNAGVPWSSFSDDQLRAIQWVVVDLIKERTGRVYPRY